MTKLIYLVCAIGMLATMMMALGAGNAYAVGMAGSIIGALLYLTFKAETSRRQVAELHRLQNAYDQLDQQAKLIIRTDVELHHIQEELDRRLASLISLHQLGQQLQVNLRPEEVFSKVDASVVSNFGFSTALLGKCGSFAELEWCSLVGVSETSAAEMKDHLLSGPLLKQILTNPSPRILQQTATSDPWHLTLMKVLGVPVVVLVGVMTQAGPAGVVILGRPGGVVNAKADEELVAILANQLAVAVENSALYEKAWASQRKLELKVQERTRELAAANAGLVKLDKAKSDFVSAVSHELRTPLAAIKGYASLLSGGQFGALVKAQRERISKIEKHADLLTQLINNLLDIARIESGRTTMSLSPIRVDELLGMVQDVVTPQMEAKHIQYTVDRNGVTELQGDSPHLQRVFVNLLSNAIKYTPEKGTIRMGFKREGDAVVATVTDNGCGISKEDQEKLFQEFYRVNDQLNQQVRGTGLGLALVKRIVEAHHGRIWVTSEKGKGSTFSVSLPLQQEG